MRAHAADSPWQLGLFARQMPWDEPTTDPSDPTASINQPDPDALADSLADANATLPHNLYRQATLKDAVQFGFEHLHIPAPRQITPAICEQAQTCLQGAEMPVELVFVGFAGCDYQSLDLARQTVGLGPIETRARRTLRLLDAIPFAQAIKAQGLGLHLGVSPHPKGWRHDADFLHALVQAADTCADDDLTLNLETGQEPADDLASMLGHLGHPALKINFDPANFLLYGTSPPTAALRVLAPWTTTFHLKDALLDTDLPWHADGMFGFGQVPFAEIFKTLAQQTSVRSLTLEREHRLAPDLEFPHLPDFLRAGLVQHHSAGS